MNVSFEADVQDGPRASTLNFTWNFGEDNVSVATQLNVTPGSAVTSDASYDYHSVGTFPVTVLVDDGVDPNVSASTQVLTTVPVAINGSASPGTATTGRPILLAANASGGTPPYSYIWSGLPAGCNVGAQNFTCVPKLVGPFTVRVTVLDSLSDSASTLVSFLVNPRISSSASYTSWYRCDGGVSTLQDNFTSLATGGTPPYSFAWNPDDGSPIILGENVTHNYTMASTFNVTLTITDASGATTNRSIPLSTSFTSCGGLSDSGTAVPTLLIGATLGAVVAVAVLVVLLSPTQRPPTQPPVPPLRGTPAPRSAPNTAGSPPPQNR